MLNQLVIVMTAEGAAMPWNQPFSAHRMIDNQTSEDMPMNRLMIAEMNIAAEKNRRGLKWSDRKPLKNLPNA